MLYNFHIQTAEPGIQEEDTRRKMTTRAEKNSKRKGRGTRKGIRRRIKGDGRNH
jgi:hypothetical protein